MSLDPSNDPTINPTPAELEVAETLRNLPILMKLIPYGRNVEPHMMAEVEIANKNIKKAIDNLLKNWGRDSREIESHLFKQLSRQYVHTTNIFNLGRKRWSPEDQTLIQQEWKIILKDMEEDSFPPTVKQ